jgi:hypothetical protein
VNPFTLSDKVVEPGDAPLQPDEVAAAANVGDAAPKGTAPSATSAMVIAAIDPLTKRAVMQLLDCPFTTSPSLKKLLW